MISSAASPRCNNTCCDELEEKLMRYYCIRMCLGAGKERGKEKVIARQSNNMSNLSGLSATLLKI